ncbi:hypothetical protein VTK73DRAFT_1938 [Phialemonium thermophilum]|uniref:Uncharacterized protein n=1 Tax=Phialemonium thermophilum TaxID=223376 RepID=A0ABR3VST1_9PEZI
MLEAVNENRADCFGWALETAWESGVSPSPSSSSAPRLTLRPSHDRCRHHHRNRRSLLGVVDGPRRRRRTGHWAGDGFSARGGDQEEGEGVVPSSESEESSDCPTDHPGGGGGGGGDGGDGGGGEVGDQNKSGRSWLWWPSWYELRTHYLREIGFLACFSQMIGATVFWISGFTALPSIQNLLSTPALNGVYWLPQVRTPSYLPPLSADEVIPPPLCVPSCVRSS